jgi:multidrug transporter EmrE-like cation transporter
MKGRDLGLCIAFAAMMPVGQGFFKWASLTHHALEGPLPLRLIQNLPLGLAFAWYGLSAVVWFQVLRRTPLTIAYPFSLLGTALVPPLAALVFREPVSPMLALGYILMFAGFALLAPRRAA